MPAQFGLVLSAYAFSAGISGLLTAGFADRFDRKRLLLFFYAGFVVGTGLCGLAPTYALLLAAPMPSWQALRGIFAAWRARGTGWLADTARLLVASPREWLDQNFDNAKLKTMMAAWGMHLDFAPDCAGGALFPYLEAIADQVFGYIICFARNFHHYIRQQQQALWRPVGGEEERVSFTTGPGVVNAIDRAHLHLADCTLGIVGLGAIGSEVARRGRAVHMRVLAIDPQHTQAPEGVVSVWKPDRLPELLGASDFVVIAAPHTPRTARLFQRPQFQAMKPTAYLVNIGRGAIVDLTDLTAALNKLLGTAIIPHHGPERSGDVRHSRADITLARQELGYAPAVSFEEGLAHTLRWYRR